MLIQEGLKAFIEAQVSAVGKGYPLEIPQDAAYPAWTYQVIDDDELLAHGGGTGFHRARIQIDFMAAETQDASDYDNSADLTNRLRGALNGYRGLMGTVPVVYCKTTSSDDFAEQHQIPSGRFDVLINYRQ